MIKKSYHHDPNRHDGKVILLVEDEPLVSHTLEQLLVYAGYSVLYAGTRQDALAWCRKYPGPIHIALIDLSVDNMQGNETGQDLHALRPGISILMMSGHLGPDLIRKGLLSRQTHFLQKPINPEELFTKIERLLASSQHDAGALPA